MSSPDDLESLVTNFCKNLFSDTDSHPPFVLTGHFPLLEDPRTQDTGTPPGDSEIHEAMRNIGGFKAPGADGVQAVFYHTQWHIVGPSVCSFVRDCFHQPERIASVNDTLIMLIPKVESVVNMKNFRLISLCNVSYKIIMKILARRLRSIMEVLVSPHQCSFVPNMQSRDNIIIAQEVIHSMRTKKGKKGWMTIKIDLEKAYDRLSWDFVRDTLQDIGLPDNFICLVWHCISSPRMRVV